MTEPNAEDMELSEYICKRLDNPNKSFVAAQLAAYRTRIEAKHLAALRECKNGLIYLTRYTEQDCKCPGCTALKTLKELGV